METENKKNNKLIYILIAVLVVAICACAVYFVFLKKDDNGVDNTPTNQNTKNNQKGTEYEFANNTYIAPEGMSVKTNEEEKLVVNISGENWHAEVIALEGRNESFLDETYNYSTQNETITDVRFSKNKIGDKSILAIESKTEKMSNYYFVGKNNVVFSVMINYSDETFDYNKIKPIVESLSNPIK